MSAHCGLRFSEMLSLLQADLHLGGERPYLTVTGKRQKRQEVPLSKSAARALKNWIEMTPRLGPTVLSLKTRKGISENLQLLCEAVGVRYDKRHVHGLRHMAGTEVYRATRDLLEVRDLLRHASMETSPIYVKGSRRPSGTP